MFLKYLFMNEKEKNKNLGFELNQGIGSGKYSVLKTFHHPQKLSSFLEKKVTAPIYVRIKPTNTCPHNCFYCIYRFEFSGIHPESVRTDMIPKEKMFEILDDLKAMGIKAVTFSGGGEPLHYPWINEVLKKVLDSKMDFSIITNGQLLHNEAAELLSQAKWIRVSLDYPDAETFSKIRGVPPTFFDQIKENIKKFGRMKNSNCSLGVNCVINEHNYDKVIKIVELCEELGIDNLRFAPVWKSSYEEYHKNIKDEALRQIEEARKNSPPGMEIGSTYGRYFDGSTGGSVRAYDRCYYMQIVPVIAANQNVYACHNSAYDPEARIGSIKDRSFKEMWFSRETEDFFNNFNPKKSCQHECSNDEKNKILNEFINCAHPDVVNFI
jgi:radical SAM protein with 4Fe4S-binding SPASM domain